MKSTKVTGKCAKCKLFFTWEAGPSRRLIDAFCAKCGTPVGKTCANLLKVEPEWLTGGVVFDPTRCRRCGAGTIPAGGFACEPCTAIAQAKADAIEAERVRLREALAASKGE